MLDAQILKMDHLVEAKALASFLADCQFKFGGISKCQGEHPGKCSVMPSNDFRTDWLLHRPLSYLPIHRGIMHVSAFSPNS